MCPYETSDPQKLRCVISGAFGDDPEVDQMLATYAEAERLAPHNAAMVDDPYIAWCLRESLRGQSPLTAERNGPQGRAAPNVGIVLADWEGTQVNEWAVPVPTDGGPVTRRELVRCRRCENPLRQPIVVEKYDVFWIACGRLIAEFVFCSSCAFHYVNRYGAVPRRDPYAEV